VFEAGLSMETVHQWLAFGLQACQTEDFTHSDKEIVYGVLREVNKVNFFKV
jgi:hypothetical protein